MIKYITILSVVMLSSIALVSATVDPLQSAIDDILRLPTVTKSNLADGSIVTTIGIAGNYPTQAGTIVPPDGRTIQFTTQPNQGSSMITENTNLINNITNPALNNNIDYLNNNIYGIVQSTTSNIVDTFTRANSVSQGYTTTLTDSNNRSIIVQCSLRNPCTSASVLSASNGRSFDFGSTTILPAISSVLSANTLAPIQSDPIREVRPPVLDTTPAGFTRIFTSEKVPGANCVCVKGTGTDGKPEYDPTGRACGGSVTNRKYECTVPTGLAGFQSVFAKLIRFVINIVLLLGVLSVVGLGIAWSFAGGDDIKAKSSLKKWAINILIGLAILFFFRYILAFLAPWVYE